MPLLNETNTRLADLLFGYLILRNAERIGGIYFSTNLGFVKTFLQIPDPNNISENTIEFYQYVLSNIIEISNNEYRLIIESDPTAANSYNVSYFPVENNWINYDGRAIIFQIRYSESTPSVVFIISIINQVSPSDTIPFYVPGLLDRLPLLPERRT